MNYMGKSWCGRSLVAALVLGLAAGGASAQVMNGSFETGDFTDWIATDLEFPLSALDVVEVGTIPIFGTNSAPTDGDFSVVTGFEAATPGTISLTQDLKLDKAAPLLLLDYVALWDLLNFVQTSQIDRVFRIVVAPTGGGAELASFEVLRVPALSAFLDPERITAAVDLSDFAGQSVQLGLLWEVPESSTGPAWFELDNVRLAGAKPAALDVASLNVRLDFAKPDKDSIKLDVIVPAGLEPAPKGDELTITVGSIARSYELDATGAAQEGDDKVKLLPVKNDLSQRKLVLSWSKGDFAFDFAPYGLLNETTSKAGITLEIPLVVTHAGITTERLFTVVYKSKVGKTGQASGKSAGEAWSTKLGMKLDFATPGQDTLTLSTAALTGPGFAPVGEEISVEIGGVLKTFTLDADGKAVNDGDSIAVKRDRTNPARQLVTLKCKAGSLQAVSDAFVDENTPAGGVPVTVPVTVSVGEKITKTIVQLTYSAKAGKTGKAKN